jgi:signal transduction histidine kinase
VTDHGNIALAVADAGCGIEKKDQDRIFLRFYTTKSGETGLGLPMVKKIGEAHGETFMAPPIKEEALHFVPYFQSLKR